LSRTQLGDFSHAAELLEQAIARRPESALLIADFEAVMRHLEESGAPTPRLPGAP